VGLEGKVAIVTDAGSENGAAIARRFLDEGADVAVCKGAGIRALPMPDDLPPTLLRLEGDICTPADARRMVDEVVSRFGRVDVLVNHGAGGRLVGTVMDVTQEDFNEAMTGDVWSVFALSSAVITVMQKSGRGAIVNISSIGRNGLKNRPLRSSSQAAVAALTASMAMDHAGDGIRINGLLLGPTLSSRMPAEQTAELSRRAPLGQIHSPADVAAAALFLASDESKMITGTFLTVDAGRSMPSSV
jgi:NAD(P)-dependent dehydrogenase (short-subunit alcohol dehydrogenase family)